MLGVRAPILLTLVVQDRVVVHIEVEDFAADLSLFVSEDACIHQHLVGDLISLLAISGSRV